MEIETVCLDPEENLTCSAFLFKIFLSLSFHPFPFFVGTRLFVGRTCTER